MPVACSTMEMPRIRHTIVPDVAELQPCSLAYSTLHTAQWTLHTAQYTQNTAQCSQWNYLYWVVKHCYSSQQWHSVHCSLDTADWFCDSYHCVCSTQPKLNLAPAGLDQTQVSCQMCVCLFLPHASWTLASLSFVTLEPIQLMIFIKFQAVSN